MRGCAASVSGEPVGILSRAANIPISASSRVISARQVRSSGRRGPATWLMQGWRLEEGFDVLRGDVLPARGDDDVLLAVRDPDETLRVDLGDVPRVEPAVGVDRRGGRLGVPVITPEESLAAEEELISLAQLRLDAVDEPADGAELEVIRPVDRNRGDGLGEAVALQDEQSRGVEEFEELRSASGRRRRRGASPVRRRHPGSSGRRDGRPGRAGKRKGKGQGPPLLPVRWTARRPTSIAQAKIRRLSGELASIRCMIRAWIFSKIRGTPTWTVGLSSRKLSISLSMLSA